MSFLWHTMFLETGFSELVMDRLILYERAGGRWYQAITVLWTSRRSTPVLQVRKHSRSVVFQRKVRHQVSIGRAAVPLHNLDLPLLESTRSLLKIVFGEMPKGLISFYSQAFLDVRPLHGTSSNAPIRENNVFTPKSRKQHGSPA